MVRRQGNQKLVIDWTMISDTNSARAFGDQLAEAPRSFADRTSISGGIDFAMAQFERAPYSARRRTIDVSGDGTNNAGRDVVAARDDVVRQGVTINGLVILSERPLPWNPEHTNPPGGLPKYFHDNVIGGPGSFVIVAEDFKSFGQALINKMIAEIASRPSPHRQAADAVMRVTAETICSKRPAPFGSSMRNPIHMCGQRRSACFWIDSRLAQSRIIPSY